MKYVERNNHHLLADLFGQHGFESVQLSLSVDHNNSKKKSFKVGYDLPSLGWFNQPPPDELYYDSNLRIPDTYGVWPKSVKRPTTDRHFCPKDSLSEDHKSSFLTCPPSVCLDSKMRQLLESKPLVSNHGARRYWKFLILFLIKIRSSLRKCLCFL